MKNKILLLICLLGLTVSVSGQIIKSSMQTSHPKQYNKVEIDIEP